MLPGCGWPRAAPSLLTLCTARTPCTACASHTAWETDGLSTCRRSCGSGQGFQVKPQRVQRRQRWSLAHSKEIRCDSKRESTLGWSTSIMKSPS